jgi:hypothetical protein
MSASRAANDIVPLSSTRRLGPVRAPHAVQPHELLGHDDRVAVEDLGEDGEGVGTPAERDDSKETGHDAPEHRAT